MIAASQRLAWRYPEWWSIGLSLIAWLVIIVSPEHHGHTAHDGTAASLSGWLVMVAAMMFPLLLGSIRTVAARSLWMRRHRAIAAFLAGYTAPWLLFGLAASLAISALRHQTGYTPFVLASAWFGIAAVWQLSPMKRRTLVACHRTRPIAPNGWQADRDCLNYGWAVGVQCVGSCWALMGGCAAAGHSVAAMIGVSAVTGAERYARRPDRKLLSIAVAGFALTYALLAVTY